MRAKDRHFRAHMCMGICLCQVTGVAFRRAVRSQGRAGGENTMGGKPRSDSGEPGEPG